MRNDFNYEYYEYLQQSYSDYLADYYDDDEKTDKVYENNNYKEMFKKIGHTLEFSVEYDLYGGRLRLYYNFKNKIIELKYLYADNDNGMRRWNKGMGLKYLLFSLEILKKIKINYDDYTFVLNTEYKCPTKLLMYYHSFVRNIIELQRWKQFTLNNNLGIVINNIKKKINFTKEEKDKKFTEDILQDEIKDGITNELMNCYNYEFDLCGEGMSYGKKEFIYYKFLDILCLRLRKCEKEEDEEKEIKIMYDKLLYLFGNEFFDIELNEFTEIVKYAKNKSLPSYKKKCRNI